MTEQPPRVVITDVDIPFMSLVGLLVKIALALIPAAMILGILAAIVIEALKGLGSP